MVKWRIIINGEVIETSNLNQELIKLMHRYGAFTAKNTNYGSVENGGVVVALFYFPRANKTAKVFRMIEKPAKATGGTPPRQSSVRSASWKKSKELSTTSHVPPKTATPTPKPATHLSETVNERRRDVKKWLILGGGLLLLMKILKR